MKKKSRVISFTLAAAMAAGLLGGCSSSAQGGTSAQDAASSPASAAESTAAAGEEDHIIKVGVVCAMTGGSSIYGEGAQNAVDMAVEEINASDSEYKIEIVNGGNIADDAKDAKQAMNAYNKVMADGPEALVGSFFSSVTLPMAEQASKDGMLLATGATNTEVTKKGDTIFRNCFIDPYQGKMAALFVKSKGITNASYCRARSGLSPPGCCPCRAHHQHPQRALAARWGCLLRWFWVSFSGRAPLPASRLKDGLPSSAGRVRG